MQPVPPFGVIAVMDQGTTVESPMRLPLAIAAMLLSAAPLGAQPGRGAEALNVGRGVICDTAEQAQRFVALRNSGSATVQALQVINREAAKPTACGEAMVAFRLGEPIQDAKVEGLAVNVVKITVVAFSDGRRWSTVPETVQYAIVAPQGIEV
jgi:hypothetical protein